MSIAKNTIRVNERYQTIESFGASDCWSMQNIGQWSDDARNRVADLLFSTDKGIGLSCWRFNVGAGINHETISNPWRTVETFEVGEGVYDWTRQAGERWFLRAAKRRGVPQFVAFVNSPPGRMTRNGLTNCTTGNDTTNLKAGYESQFACFLADVVQHFRDNPDPAERVLFDFVSPVNEPEWDWHPAKQEGNRAGNADLKRIITALGREFEARALPSRIIAPEAGSLPDMVEENREVSGRYGVPYGDYVDALCGDADVARWLDKRIVYHSYWSDSTDRVLSDRRGLRAAIDAYPDWAVWQTEYCVMQGGRDLSMETALHAARIIHMDLTVVNAAAWHWWLAMSNVDYNDGLLYTDYRQPGDPESIIESKLLWAFGNFSRFVRPGMVRVGLTPDSDDPGGLLGSAYADLRHGTVAVVYVNMSHDEKTVSLNVADDADMLVDAFVPYITSDRPGDDLRQTAFIRPGSPFTIPPRSVITLVSAAFA